MKTSEDLWKRLANASPEPQQSCPIIDQEIREAKNFGKDMVKEARATEDTRAKDALLGAETFSDTLESTLETLRGINGDLRSRCDDIEKTADQAIESLEAAEATIAELEAAKACDTQVIGFLTERVNKSWWRRLLDHTQAAWYARTATVLAQRNRQLRFERTQLHEEIGELLAVIGEAADYLHRQEFTHQYPNHPRCPECLTEWRGFSITPPEHDETCEIGELARKLRWALQVKR